MTNALLSAAVLVAWFALPAALAALALDAHARYRGQLEAIAESRARRAARHRHPAYRMRPTSGAARHN